MQSAEILDQLDRQWTSGGCPDLSALIAKVPAIEPELIWELCAADLEWRWRMHAQKDADCRDDFLPATPRAADYRRLLNDQWNDPNCQRNLIEAEWCARSIWGDSPDVEDFSKSLPTIADWNSRLGNTLNALVPLEANLTSRSMKRPFDFRVSHDFIIGRQGLSEPKAPAWVEATSRLIVANSHYRVVSREQLKVRRTRLREVEVVNVSKVISGTWGGQHLEPGESTRSGICHYRLRWGNSMFCLVSKTQWQLIEGHSNTIALRPKVAQLPEERNEVLSESIVHSFNALLMLSEYASWVTRWPTAMDSAIEHHIRVDVVLFTNFFEPTE